MAYVLDISVFGEGTDPNYRSHWGFVIYKAGQDRGELLHVKLLDLKTLRYQFEEREAVLVSTSSTGRWRVTTLTEEQRRKVKEVLRKVPAPADGKRRCQDWVVDACIDLEVEGLIPAGFSERCGGFRGMSAERLGSSVGKAWITVD